MQMANYDETLSELSLAPSALLTFAWHPEVANEVASQLGPNPAYLKEEIVGLARVQQHK